MNGSSPPSPIHNDDALLSSDVVPTREETSAILFPPHADIRNIELGEVDTAEDSIDGMGAIKFTNEEDCGYFGIEHSNGIFDYCLQTPRSLF
jgi:hypothetical protein